jgi:hypothetical protein
LGMLTLSDASHKGIDGDEQADKQNGFHDDSTIKNWFASSDGSTGSLLQTGE